GRQRQHRPRDLVLLHERSRQGAGAVRPVARDRSVARQDAAQHRHRPGLRQAGPERGGGSLAEDPRRRAVFGRGARGPAGARRRAVGASRARDREAAGVVVIRLMIWLVLASLVLRGVVRLLRGLAEGLQGPPAPKPPTAVPLARDPVCGTYVVP